MYGLLDFDYSLVGLITSVEVFSHIFVVLGGYNNAKVSQLP